MPDTIIDAWDTIVKCEPMKADKIAPVSGLEPLTRRDVALLRLAAILLQKGRDDERNRAGDDRKIICEVLRPVLEKILAVPVTEAELEDAIADVCKRSCEWTAYEILS